MANHTEDCAFQLEQGGIYCDCGLHTTTLKTPPAGLEIKEWIKAIRFTANQGDTSRWGLQGIIVELCDRVDQLNEELTSQGVVNAETGMGVQPGNKVGFCRGFAYGARYASAPLHIEHTVPNCPLSGVDLSKTWVLSDLIFEEINRLGREIKANTEGDDSSSER